MVKIRARSQRQAGAIILVCSFLAGFGIGSVIYNASTDQGEVLFTIAYSSEKEGWMAEIKPFFDEWCSARFPGLRIKANFFPVGSRESIIAILNGQYTPCIWSPAASTWIPMLNYYWAQQPAHAGQAITTENVTAVYSPIVIAMWDSISSNYNITSIQDVYDLTLTTPSPIKLAHTDPRLSNSGFCTIIMEVAAAAGKNSSDLTLEDLSDASIKAWVKQFESVAVQYGKSTGYLIQSMLQAGPSGITTAFLYENLVIESAAEAQAQWADRIMAIYPAEGCVHSDHPFCLLDHAPWMTPTLLNISRCFMNEFLNETKILELATHHGFRVYDGTVPLPPDTFNLENGVLYNISSIPQMYVPVDPGFITRVADFWLISRPVY
ncbi:MAG: substrate-binding domain-containing protein [Candidatus Lokiarchaeota archaeon]|nr:substrate-binding domain-containing protein [Candidatus Lokiarchaeota archaeon]